MTAIERLLSVMPEVHRVREDHYRGRCPIHQGQSKTSLSIRYTGDRVLIHCHAGCDYRSILGALNLSSAADLFDRIKNTPQKAIQALARAGLSRWCNDRLIESCKSIRRVEEEIGIISSELAKYAMDQISHNPELEEKLWFQLKRAYERRTEREREIDILNGTDEAAKLDIWRSAA
jgi:hypothetical protein